MSNDTLTAFAIVTNAGVLFHQRQLHVYTTKKVATRVRDLLWAGQDGEFDGRVERVTIVRSRRRAGGAK